MPELPEVESVRRQLHPRLAGRLIRGVTVDPQARFGAVDKAAGHRIAGVGRRGKYLLAGLDPEGPSVSRDPSLHDLELVMHLGMTGSFRFRGDGWAPDPYVRAAFELDDDVLEFRDVRRFGRLTVVPAGEYRDIPTLAALGPEPLDEFDPARFHADLARTTMAVKTALLSQRPVAGVGNIYADEALWRARISPFARRLSRTRTDRLRIAIREVLAEAIGREGTTFRDYQMVNGECGRNADHLVAYGQAGRPCPRDGTPLRRVVLGGRGTTYCPRCQRA